jgi:hypothetical protein
MTYNEPVGTQPAGTTTAETTTTVADDGLSMVGILDRPLAHRLLRAVDEVAAGSTDAGPAGQFHHLGTRIRRAMFMAYSYRWLTSRDTPFEDVPEWASFPRVRRQLLEDKTVDPFYWTSGERPLDPRSAGLQEAASLGPATGT